MCVSCCSCCKLECRGRNIGFNYIHPLRFSSFMWRVPPVVYFIYRVAIALFAVVSFFMLVAYPKGGNPSSESEVTDSMAYIVLYYIVYVTYTTYLVISAVYVVLVFNNQKMWNRTLLYIPSPQQHMAKFKNFERDDLDINSRANTYEIPFPYPSTDLDTRRRPDSLHDQSVPNSSSSVFDSSSNLTPANNSPKMKYMYVLKQIIGILFQICTNMSIFNFYLFFLVSIAEFRQNGVLIQFSLFAFLVTIVELCTSAIPTRLLHIIYPQIFWIVGGIVYCSFMIISSDIIDLEPFVAALIFIGYFCQFFLPSMIIHFFIFGIFHLRCWILQKLYSRVLIVENTQETLC